MLNEEDGEKLKERKAILDDTESKIQQEKSQPFPSIIWENDLPMPNLKPMLMPMLIMDTTAMVVMVMLFPDTGLFTIYFLQSG